MSDTLPLKSSVRPARADRPEEMAVLRVRFIHPIDIPGKPVADGLAATPESERRGQRIWYRIAFIPWMRHLLIECHGPDERSIYVHESHCQHWEPSDLKTE